MTPADVLARSYLYRAIGLAESIEIPLPGVPVSSGTRAVAGEIASLIRAALAADPDRRDDEADFPGKQESLEEVGQPTTAKTDEDGHLITAEREPEGKTA